MEDYEDIKNILKPRRDFNASEDLRRRINATLDFHSRKRISLRWFFGIGTSCVAAAVVCLILIPTGMSAKEILTQTLGAFANSEGIEMIVEVRTRPMENFRYINLNDDFVAHTILISKSDSTRTWRIDKGGRTAAGNNDICYNWIEQYKIGWSTTGSATDEMLGEMAIFLTPERILEAELENCVNNPEATYSVSKKDGELILSVHAQPQGVFCNPYMLNASITESENTRRYIIDSQSKRLKSATVSMVNGNRETEVLKIIGISYNKPVANLLAIPKDTRIMAMSRTAPRGLTVSSSTEAASAFLRALETWDESILGDAIDENQKLAISERELKGAVLESVGESFISGNENTTFVPYELRLPDGTVKRHNLALQKRHSGGWVVVGGL